MGGAACKAYAPRMNFKIIFRYEQICCALGAASLAMLAGCNKAEPAPAAAAAPAAPQVTGAVVVQADYMYYPGYEVYYSPGTRVYWYMQGGIWVSGPVVPGIAVDVLFASPSVRMDFRDSPANHHAEVIQQYPRNWQPAAPSRGLPDPVRGLPDAGRNAPSPGRGMPGQGPGPGGQGQGRRG